MGHVEHVLGREHAALPRGGVAHGQLHGVQAVARDEVVRGAAPAPPPEDQEGAAGGHGQVGPELAIIGGAVAARRGRERGHRRW